MLFAKIIKEFDLSSVETIKKEASFTTDFLLIFNLNLNYEKI